MWMSSTPLGGWIKGVLIPALPLDLTAQLAVFYTIYRLAVLNGIVIGQNVGRRIIGVVYHPVGVHAVKVVLEIRQEQGTHAHCVDEHILGALDVEETDIDAKADEAVRTFDLVGAHILCQKQLAAVLEVERLTGGVQLRQSLQKVGIQVGSLQCRERSRQHIGSDHLIPALPENSLSVFLAVPHLAHEEGIEALALELVAFHHHQLHRAFAVLKFRDMIQGGKAGHFLIVTEALYRSDVFLHYVRHGFFVRHFYRLFEQHLNKIGAAGSGAFLSSRSCWNTSLFIWFPPFCQGTASIGTPILSGQTLSAGPGDWL